MSHIKRFVAAGLTLAAVASLLPMTSLAANYGWVEKDGKWYYYDSDGKKVKYDSRSRWVDGEGYKYFVLNSKGAQVTKKGWCTTNYFYTYYYNKIKIQNKYYLKSDGSVTTGWKKISKKWYYFEEDGKMAKGVVRKTVDSSTGKEKYYILGNDGARITKKGWHQVTYVDFSESTGYKTSYKIWYYVKSDGTIYRNCIKKIKGKKYLFDEEGRLVCNSIDGVRDSSGNIKTYYSTDKNGVIYTKKGWRSIKFTYSYKSSTYTYKDTATYKVYVKKGGKLHMGLKTIKGKTYYFDPTMEVCSHITVDNVMYIFGRTGACTKTVKYDNNGAI